MSSNHQPMTIWRVIASPNGALLPYHVKTHGNYWIGPLIFVPCLPFIKWNGCYQPYLIYPLTRIYLVVFYNFTFPMISLDSLLKYTEEVHLKSIKCDLMKIWSYLFFYQSEGVVTKLNSINRKFHQSNESLNLFSANSHLNWRQ